MLTRRDLIRLSILAMSCLAFSAAKAGDNCPTCGTSFHIQAHRGAGIAYPENTLESFDLSWEIGVTPEADLRTTKDGVIVCFHDKNFERVAGNLPADQKKLGIEQLTLTEIKKLDVGSFRGEGYKGQRIPTLASVFAEMKGRPERLLYLDIKDVDLDQLVALIEEYNVAPQGIFTTKYHQLIRDWKKKVPHSLSLLWNGGSEEELNKRMKAIREADFEGITYLQIHVKVGDLDSDEPFMPSIAFLEKTRDELKAHGIVFQVLPWKCSNPAAYRRLLELGTESFATDYSEMTLEAVHQFQRETAQ